MNTLHAFRQGGAPQPTPAYTSTEKYDSTVDISLTTLPVLTRYSSTHRFPGQFSVFPIQKRVRHFMAHTQSRTVLNLLATALTLPAASQTAGTYAVTNLFSDGSVPATTTDAHFINPWGMSNSATGWISTQGTGLNYVMSANRRPALAIPSKSPSPLPPAAPPPPVHPPDPSPPPVRRQATFCPTEPKRASSSALSTASSPVGTTSSGTAACGHASRHQ